MNHLTRFTCEETFRRLDDYVDRALSAAEMLTVREHLRICASCAREFNFESSVLNTVKGKLRQIDVPPELQELVLRTLSREASNGA